MSKKCSVEGCNNKYRCKGYCNRHYKQFRKHGRILDIIQHDSNEIIEYEDYAEIVLYGKDGNEVARTMIDLEYVDIVKDYKWYLTKDGYAYNSEVGRLHRFLTKPTGDLVIDHINHNRLDNRVSNLRICTRQQNNFNTETRCDNSSGITGVYWVKRNNRWVAQITINGKLKHIGYYNTKEEAAEARRQAEIEYFGEFAPTRE